MQWSRLGDLFEILCGLLFLSWTGHFMFEHFFEFRFAIPAIALHLWGVGAMGSAAVRFFRSSAIDYDASIVEIQRQLESLRVFTLRAVQVLFVVGIPIWSVPFGIVAFRSWFGIDLYAVIKGNVLSIMFLSSILLGLSVWKACEFCATRLSGSPRLQRVAGTLVGHHIAAAQSQLAKIATFELE